MRRQIIILGVVLLAFSLVAEAQIRYPPCDFACQMGWTDPAFRRVVPVDPWKYYVPRSVGVNLQAIDLSEGPIYWWSAQADQGIPNWVNAAWVRDEFGITAISLMLAAHPWDNFYENIRKLFRLDGLDIIVIRLEHWGIVDERCDGSEGVLWTEYPTGPDDNFPWYEWSVFDKMYEFYANQDKTIIITNIEADWQLQGVGCRDGEHRPEDYEFYMLREFNRRQAAAERARAANPDALLRVDHNIEVNFFGNQAWQTHTILCGIIPNMDSPPDRISFSLYKMAGDPVEALHYAMECTGLPAYRFFISEVGARNPEKQYDRITSVVNALFEEGVAFALVWDLDVWPNDTEWSVVDPVSGEWRGGMFAIQDLNEEWADD
jgi:hypothetical protein